MINRLFPLRPAVSYRCSISPRYLHPSPCSSIRGHRSVTRSLAILSIRPKAHLERERRATSRLG